jgi:DNA modification methylase
MTLSPGHIFAGLPARAAGAEQFLNGRIVLHCGDCIDVMATLPENSVDSVVCDPPYLLTSITKRFGKDGAAPATFGADGRFLRLSGGFMNKRWDAPDEPLGISVFDAWLAGFIAGEGCFRIQAHKNNRYYTCQFSIHLRADDAPILLACQKRLGGRIVFYDGRENKQGIKSKPDVRWLIETRDDCLRLAGILDRVPLFAKKANDYALWRRGLDLWINTPKGSRWHGPRDVGEMASLHRRLQEVKRWDGVSDVDLNFDPFMPPAQAFHYKWAREAYRVLKPGGHLLAFGGTRTYHRLVCAIEDAGFDVRDCISWLYGSGFPKSLDVSKAIDQRLGAKREIVGFDYKKAAQQTLKQSTATLGDFGGNNGAITAPATDLAAQWSGWGTALKPACELVCLARKPLSEGTVAANVLRWGTGALNIDGCRIGTEDTTERTQRGNHEATSFNITSDGTTGGSPLGRWPANVIHDGSDEVVAAFPETQTNSTGHGGQLRGIGYNGGASGIPTPSLPGDSGSAARFFKSCNGRDGEASAERRYGGYGGDIPPGRRRDGVEASRLFYTSKANGDDRLGSRHPTVKPLDLMQYLVRLVTPKGGTVLDPFAGTGTTGEAAFREGMRAVLIEREAEYQADIRRRVALVLAGPDERMRESVKARGMVASPGPLFETPRPEHTAEAAE